MRLVAAPYEAIESLFQGYPTRTLISHEGRIEVSFAPGVGMVGCSLHHAGDELLGQRGGLARYEATASTFGIPLLHPWANRLGGYEYRAAGQMVPLAPASPLIHKDPNDLPIHGLLAASPYWELLGADADAASARLAARLDFAEHPELLEGFPYPHELRLDVGLRDATVTIRTTLTATGDPPVPMSFGFHPYLVLPDVPRSDWEVELPVGSHLKTDERQIPTGEAEPVHIPPGPLGDR